jgi:AdoMet-dependent rRNA methyltransferase SPB1
MSRKDHEDGEWTGFSEDEKSDDDEDVVEHEQSSDDESDEEEDTDRKILVKRLDGQDDKGENGLSKRAALFFDQDIFADIVDDDDEEEEEEEEEEAEAEEEEAEESFAGFDSEGEDEEAEDDVEMEDANGAAEEDEESDDGFEIVKTQKDTHWDGDDEPMKDGRPGISPPSPPFSTTNH